jgi:hypothetical protein
VKALQSVSSLSQQLALDQASRIFGKTTRFRKTKFDKPRFNLFRDCVRFVLAEPHQPFPFVTRQILPRDH